MTTQFGSKFPQFYITAPSRCPYLDGRYEKKVFTHLMGENADLMNNALTHGGFRRSQNIAYRPACDDCNACVSVRVPVDRFQETRSFRRIVKQNRDIKRTTRPAIATEEQFSLLRSYLDQRHIDGGMSDMTALDYASMVEDTPVNTSIVEYRRRQPLDVEEKGELIAVALTDRLEDGLSMVYSFFDAEEASRSLGSFMILDHIHQAKALGLPYVYLGYWVEGSRKMAYKARFRPVEALQPDGWIDLP
ncbi:MAG: arginyltransferase [Alphaproteobacteria bacterium]|nr:arginyltransferase [Rhodobiaceae bacterium]MBO6542410.1 arginyltransferase [Alphaproteobacteria bacterium]MBO6628972.1 arginyltransferase [Alphaproteobacteria bacterium]MDF1624803.1 arginyltransferase [Parvibaculaceae bacterium]